MLGRSSHYGDLEVDFARLVCAELPFLRVRLDEWANVFDISKDERIKVHVAWQDDRKQDETPFVKPESALALITRGNYVANAIQARLRIEARKNHRLRSLSAMFDLPLELVLEIFGHLHPIDLYTLIRTTKTLRHLLLDHSATSTWETVFSRHPDVVLYPPDVSPPKWASLLFGPSTCDLCPRPRAMVDFTYRKRICNECSPSVKNYALFVEHAPHQGDFADDLTTDPAELNQFWKMVRYTYRTDDFQYPEEHEYMLDPRYALEDACPLAKQVSEFLLAIEQGQPDARDTFEWFKAQTLLENRVNIAYVKTCNRWSYDIYQSLVRKFKAQLSLLFSRLRKHLLKRGYNPLDVSWFDAKDHEFYAGYFAQFIISRSSYKFTKKEMYRHLPILEGFVKDIREKRMRNLAELREGEIVQFYRSEVQPTLPCSMWGLFPNHWRILDLDGIADYVDLESELEDPPERIFLPHFREKIVSFIDQWLPERKRRLTDILITSQPGSFTGDYDGLGVANSVLDLATAVFMHPLGHYACGTAYHRFILFGWGETRLHTSCVKDSNLGESPDEEDLVFHRRGYEAVSGLLRLLVLDPTTTFSNNTALLNARFLCLLNDSPQRKESGGLALDWKQCVRQIITAKEESPECLGPFVVLLPEEVAESIRVREPVFPFPGDPLWSCKHCSEHFNNRVTRSNAVKHVRASHSVSTPVEDVDFFHLRSATDTVRSPTVQIFGWNDGSNHRCLMCQGRSRYKLWVKQDLFAHLNKTHRINDSAEGIHWKHLAVIDKTTHRFVS